LYSYDVDATDDDNGDTLSYFLDTAPAGMTINSGSGLIQWTPTDLQLGDHAVTVRVDDVAGSSDTQSFVITVDAATFNEFVVFSDNFESGSLTDQWTQDSQIDWKRATGKKFDGSYAAEVDGSATDATLISAPIDMSGYGSADLTFAWLIEKGFDNNEFLAIDFKNDAGQWIDNVRILNGNVDQENAWHQETVRLEDLPDNYLHSNFQFRFRSTVSSSREDAYVDVVELTATSAALRGAVAQLTPSQELMSGRIGNSSGPLKQYQMESVDTKRWQLALRLNDHSYSHDYYQRIDRAALMVVDRSAVETFSSRSEQRPFQTRTNRASAVIGLYEDLVAKTDQLDRTGFELIDNLFGEIEQLLVEFDLVIG
jgi:hypothetical protein